MHRDFALAILRCHVSDLRSMGLRRLSLFGSTARDEATSGSDVDLAVQLDSDQRIDLFGYAAIAEHLRILLATPVDVVTEPNRSARLQAMIDRDRVDVF